MSGIYMTTRVVSFAQLLLCENNLLRLRVDLLKNPCRRPSVLLLAIALEFGAHRAPCEKK